MRLNCFASVMISFGPISEARAATLLRVCAIAISAIDDIDLLILRRTSIAMPMAMVRIRATAPTLKIAALRALVVTVWVGIVAITRQSVPGTRMKAAA